uniref:HAT C-terminal dimerisation domain-containing protein n=1 Tax=Fagus sylvatica TaxID=28930 RepID=A0A2N9J0F8_FAGSY
MKAQCNYCKKHLLGESKQGTNHLRTHLKRCPSLKLRGDLRRQVMIKEQGKANKKVSASPYNFDQEGSREDLAHMVIMHEYPLAMVDHVGFRRFVSGLQPNFKLVSRNTLKRDILKIYDYERQKSMAKIDNNGSRVAITTDLWTSSNKKRGFMVVTRHYINDSWILESQIMRFIYVPSPHTKEVLSTVLLECLLEWNVDRKLSTVTVDNCTTNDAMMRILLEKLEVSSLALESAFSTSGRLLSPHRSRLHPRTLEALMCAQSWLWSELKGSSSMPEDATIQNILEDFDDHEEEESGSMELAD